MALPGAVFRGATTQHATKDAVEKRNFRETTRVGDFEDGTVGLDQFVPGRLHYLLHPDARFCSRVQTGSSTLSAVIHAVQA
jgi:hypothetical protein